MATKNFKSLDSLKSVEKVINEASTALNSKTNTIVNSAIPEILAGALGAGIGGIGSFAVTTQANAWA
jgi:hydrogenase maturation factor HypE